MISYLTGYNAGGSILRVISCPQHLVSLQRPRPGEFLLKGRGNSVTQKVVDGKVVDKTPAELNALKMKNPKLRFDKNWRGSQK